MIAMMARMAATTPPRITQTLTVAANGNAAKAHDMVYLLCGKHSEANDPRKAAWWVNS